VAGGGTDVDAGNQRLTLVHRGCQLLTGVPGKESSVALPYGLSRMELQI
jgi:hypothetical protein